MSNLGLQRVDFLSVNLRILILFLLGCQNAVLYVVLDHGIHKVKQRVLVSVLLCRFERLDIPALGVEMHRLVHTLSDFYFLQLSCVCCQFLVHTLTHWFSQSVHLRVEVLVRLSLFDGERVHSFSLVLKPVFYLIYFLALDWFPIKTSLRLVHILFLFLVAQQVCDWVLCSNFKGYLCILVKTSFKTRF